MAVDPGQLSKVQSRDETSAVSPRGGRRTKDRAKHADHAGPLDHLKKKPVVASHTALVFADFTSEARRSPLPGPATET